MKKSTSLEYDTTPQFWDSTSGDPTIYRPGNGKSWPLFPSTGLSIGKTPFHVPAIQAEDFTIHGSYNIVNLPVGVPVLGYYTATKGAIAVEDEESDPLDPNLGDYQLDLQAVYRLKKQSKSALLTLQGPKMVDSKNYGVFPDRLTCKKTSLHATSQSDRILLRRLRGLWIYGVATTLNIDDAERSTKFCIKALCKSPILYLYSALLATHNPERGTDYYSTVKTPWLWGTLRILLNARYQDFHLTDSWVLMDYYAMSNNNFTHRIQPHSFLGWRAHQIQKARADTTDASGRRALQPICKPFPSLPYSTTFVVFQRSTPVLRRLA